MKDPLFIFAIALLGIGATVQYFLGVKKNRWLGKLMSTQAENVFKPKDTNYVNIGGAIGFNFVYKMREPWKEVKGSFTLFPRHSLLYQPFSLAIGNSDRFYLNLFTEKKLAGEGHIVEKRHLNRTKIDGIDSMERMEVQKAGKSFTLLWRQGDLKQALQKTLDSFPEPETLSHFCCYGDNKTFFLFLRPKKGAIENNLRKFVEICPEYFR